MVSRIELTQLLNELGMIRVPALARLLVSSGPLLFLPGEAPFGGAEMFMDPSPVDGQSPSLTTPPVATSVRTLLALCAMKTPPEGFVLPLSG